MHDDPISPQPAEASDDRGGAAPDPGTEATEATDAGGEGGRAAQPDRSVSRRKVLVTLGALGATAAIGGTAYGFVRHRSAADAPATTAPAAAPTPTVTDGVTPGVLVLITLYGGNDGLNTLVPFTDPAYLTGRGDLAIGPAEVLQLDAQLGLNPGLTGFKQLWDNQHLAIVRGVGYPNPNRSHFRSMDIWQSATPDRIEPTGWLGRWLDGTDHDPLRALAIGTTLPLALRGATSTAGVVPSGKFTLPAGNTLDTAFRQLAGGGAAGPPLAAAVGNANRDLITIQERIAAIDAADNAAQSQSLEPDVGVSTTNPLATQLSVVAKAVRAGAATQVYSVSLGGFDTHAAERTAHIALQRTLGDAVAGFFAELDGHPTAAAVTVMVYSEFGRRVTANASGGTDHGTAAPVFIAGPQVRGGYYGEQPSLTDLDQGDLKHNVDFRSIYATLLERVLLADATKILGTTPQPLPFL
jgi:uncharacterized protein (DUF1501 family)